MWLCEYSTALISGTQSAELLGSENPQKGGRSDPDRAPNLAQRLRLNLLNWFGRAKSTGIRSEVVERVAGIIKVAFNRLVVPGISRFQNREYGSVVWLRNCRFDKCGAL